MGVENPDTLQVDALRMATTEGFIQASLSVEKIPINNATINGNPLDAGFLRKVKLCLIEIIAHTPSLIIKQDFYDARFIAINIGIAIPPQLALLNETVGWAAKAVDTLTERSRIQGYDGDNDSGLEVGRLLQDANFDYLSLATTECTLGCAFAVVTQGAAGEPDVLVTVHSPRTASVLLSPRTGRPSFGITTHDWHKGIPRIINAYSQDFNVTLTMDGGNTSYSATVTPHDLGVVQMVDFAHRRSVNRPFGRSRITAPVRAICENAVREMLRTEVASEYFTAPQKFLMGATEEAIVALKEYRQNIGDIFAASADEEGNVPTFGQLSQGSMEPHVAYLRQLAAQFAAETGVPLNSLGVVQDNPSSAEAIQASREDIIAEAQLLNQSNTNPMTRLCGLVARIGGVRHDKPITPAFASASYSTQTAQADAAIKMAQAVPALAGTTVLMRRLGFSDEEIQSMKEENRRDMNMQILKEAMTSAATPGNPQPVQSSPEQTN